MQKNFGGRSSIIFKSVIRILKWNCWRTTGLPLHLGKVTLHRVIHAYSNFLSSSHGPLMAGGTPRRILQRVHIFGIPLQQTQNETNCVLGSLGNPIPSKSHNISYFCAVGVLQGYSSLSDGDRWHFRLKEGSWGRSGLGNRPGLGTLAVFFCTSLSVCIFRMF